MRTALCVSDKAPSALAIRVVFPDPEVPMIATRSAGARDGDDGILRHERLLERGHRPGRLRPYEDVIAPDFCRERLLVQSKMLFVHGDPVSISGGL